MMDILFNLILRGADPHSNHWYMGVLFRNAKIIPLVA